MVSVLLLTVDCLRADHVGCYGYDRPTTPNIDELATNGIRFENAFANCPGTRWAFQSLHTGLYTSQIKGLGIPKGFDGVLAQQFQEAGYATAGFSKNGFVSSDYGYDIGFDHFVDVHELNTKEHPVRRIGRYLDRALDSQVLRERLFRPLRNAFDKLRHRHMDEGFTPDISDKTITDAALEWITDRQAAGEPYFAWLHLMNAHTPYGRWSNHLEAIRGDTEIEHTIHPGDEGLITPGETPPKRVLDTYDAAIRSVDEQIGRLKDAVDDDTIIVVTGDHGEEFGRNKPFHTESFYEEFVHVPLIVRSDDFDAGQRFDPVQHLDIPPTITAAVNINPPNDWFGQPLQSTHRDSEDPIFFDLDRDRRAVHRGEWKLICDEDDPELYNVRHGQFETDSVTEQYPEKLDDLLTLLDDHDRHLREQRLKGRINNKGSGSPASEELSEEVEENLENLGYIE